MDIRGDEQRRLRRQYQGLYDEVLAILARHDPIGIVFGDESLDEYEPEVDMILPRLRDGSMNTDPRLTVRRMLRSSLPPLAPSAAGRK